MGCDGLRSFAHVEVLNMAIVFHGNLSASRSLSPGVWVIPEDERHVSCRVVDHVIQGSGTTMLFLWTYIHSALE